MIKVKCSRCDGKGTLQALVWLWEKPHRERCSTCKGNKFVELDEELWDESEPLEGKTLALALKLKCTESELTALRERVASVEALLAAEVGRNSVPVSPLARHILEVLRDPALPCLRP